MNDQNTIAENALSALANGDTVTVTRFDGKSATGQIVEHPTEPGLYKVRTGRRGRPLLFALDDIDDLTFES